MNVEKYEVCWIGGSKRKKHLKCKWISVSQDTIQVSETHFSYDKLLEEMMNFDDFPIDLRTLLNLWKQKCLSLAGKIQVFKSLIASKPVYNTTTTKTDAPEHSYA